MRARKALSRNLFRISAGSCGDIFMDAHLPSFGYIPQLWLMFAIDLPGIGANIAIPVGNCTAAGPLGFPSQMTEKTDCVVIGAGVVGLAIAATIARSGREVIVLEAADAFGTGMSSRNSEVLHAGLYYPVGSLKASLCVAGRQSMDKYCERRQVEHRRIGKIVVACRAEEIPLLHTYATLGAANGVQDLRMLTAEEVRSFEPNIRCVAGLLSPSTGVIDSHALMVSFIGDVESAGGAVICGSPVISGELRRRDVSLNIGGSAPTALLADAVVNAAGLDAQAVSRSITGVAENLIPTRYLAKGHYFAWVGNAPFSRLVYPVANTAGLGVHVTLDLTGRVRFGPDVQWIDSIDYSFQPGLAASFAAAISQYFPAVEEARLQPGYVGIRSKLVGQSHVSADFCIRGPREHGGAPYVALYGIESPGLTASLSLAQLVGELLR
jgi:L-2-hydroxyglutarate oxidase LhgO